MIRCCLCRRAAGHARPDRGIEPTDLSGGGYRCIDRVACRKRVRATVEAHTDLAVATTAKCSAEFRDASTVHTHNCIDYADHSAGAHVCGHCGIIWGFKGARATIDGWVAP